MKAPRSTGAVKRAGQRWIFFEADFVKGVSTGLRRTASAPLKAAGLCFRVIFMPCGRAPAQMALLLIHAQHLLHLVVQGVVLLFQAVCNILVYRLFADTECLGRAAHGGAGLRDVLAQLHCPFFRIALHAATTPYLCLLYLYGGFGRFMRTKRCKSPARRKKRGRLRRQKPAPGCSRRSKSFARRTF